MRNGNDERQVWARRRPGVHGARAIPLVAAALAIGLVMGSANAGPAAQIIAGPGAFGTNYLTPRVIMLKGSNAVFRNFDTAPHNVVSVNYLFTSGAAVGLGKSDPVDGVSALGKGSYKFFCTLHANMKGVLIVK